LAVAFDAAADALDAGVFLWRPEYRAVEVIDDDAWDEIVRARNDEAAADGAFDPGITKLDLHSPLTWPEDWQRACGIDVQAAAPRGSTATIAEFLATSPASATIAGRIAGLTGSAEGSRINLVDSTGSLAVWCPSEADPFNVVRNRNSIEIDVLRSSGSRADGERDVERLQATIQSEVFRGDTVAAQAAVLQLAGFAGPEVVDAIAVAIRPGEGLFGG
jgi:hypothetical protein